ALLAARFGADAVRAVERRLPRRGRGLAAVAAARGGRPPQPDSDHVRHRRRTLAARARDRLAAGVRGQRAGAYWQRGGRADAAGCVRRAGRDAARRPHGGPGAAGGSLAHAESAAQAVGAAMEPARPWHLGNARRAPGLYAFAADVLGGAGPHHQVVRALRPGGTGGVLAQTERNHSPRYLHTWL